LNLWNCALLLGILLAASATSSANPQDAQDNLSVFKSPGGQARYLEAYNATLAQWPVPYESLFIPTRFGITHVIASGPIDAPPMVLLHAASASATQWFPDTENLSRNYRIYALDTLGDVGMSKVGRQPQNRSDLPSGSLMFWTGLILKKQTLWDHPMVAGSP
jgi:pimeloyl-ACP methyl ester carboxylesterase